MTITVQNTQIRWKLKRCLVEVIAFEKWSNGSEDQKYVGRTLWFYLGKMFIRQVAQAANSHLARDNR